MQKLKQFEDEFEQLKSNNKLTKARKTMLLSNVMTKMEHEFKISALNDEAFNAKNEKVITLYRQISDARKF